MFFSNKIQAIIFTLLFILISQIALSEESGYIIGIYSGDFIGGVSTTVRVHVKNTGSGDDMIIEWDSKPNNWTIEPDSRNPYIESQTEYYAAFTITPPITGGAGTIIWKFYDDDLGPHPIGSNLLDTKNQYVTAVASKPDLIVQNISISPTTPKAGESVSITATLKNQGNADCSQFDLKYYLDDAYIGEDSCTFGLNAWESNNESCSYTVSNAGSHTIRVFVDSDNEIYESNENNNNLEKTYFWEGTIDAEISIDNIQDVDTGNTVTIPIRVTNTGNTAYEFGIGCDINDTERNTLIGRPSTLETSTLDPGESQTMFFQYIIPKTCLSGEYKVICAVWNGAPGDGQRLHSAYRNFSVKYKKHSELFPWTKDDSECPYTFEDDLTKEPYNYTERNSPDYRYFYCRRGVLQSDDNIEGVLESEANLDFSALTVTDTIPLCKEDLFLMRCKTTISTPEDCFPDGGEFISWESPNLRSSINILLNECKCKIYNCASSWNYHLFRRLHFEDPEDTNGNTIGNNHKKLIVLIHGWNPSGDSNPFKYEDEDGSDEEKKYFQLISERLKFQLNTINKDEWKIIEYNWAADADTGKWYESSPNSSIFKEKEFEKKIDPCFTQHGTEAAEVAHVHGQFLGEYLIENCPDIEKVQFIAHSAGSWCARTAATYIANHSSTIQYQVTFLDPYMPREGLADSVLGKKIIGRLDNHLTNKPIYLENYYTEDIKTLIGTEQIFDWTNGLRIQENLGGPLDHYHTHSDPVKFFADTIIGTVPSEVDIDWQNTGWYISLPYREPEVSIIRPSSNISISDSQSSYYFSGTASNNANTITKIEYRVNSMSWQTASGTTNWSFTASNLRMGTNTIEVRARESFGIYSDIETRIITRIESTVHCPTVSITSPSSNQTIPNNQSSYPFTGTASDEDGAVEKVQYRINSGTWINASGTTSWSFTANNLNVGNNEIEVHSEDNQGYYSDFDSRIITRQPLIQTDDAYEENDTLSSAYDLTSHIANLLSNLSGKGKQFDDDWYKIGALSDRDKIEVNCTFTHSEGNIDIELYDYEGNLMSSSTSSTDNEQVIDSSAYQSETCYVRVYAGNAGNEYDLWWDEPIPVNYDRYYVSKNGNDANDGSSWNKAFLTISKALSRDSSGNQIWVAEGTYQEEKELFIPEGISLYGGFTGTESALSQRDIQLHDTIINGKGGRCITNNGFLHGFHITGGSLIGYYLGAAGIENHGTVSNCSIYNNKSFCEGGIENHGIVRDSKIFNNLSYYSAGGASNSETGIITNSIVYSNTGTYYETAPRICGGIYNQGSIINCSIFGNKLNNSEYGGIRNNSGSITNCIVWNNEGTDITGDGIVRYCCYENAPDTGSSISSDPQFENISGESSTWDFHLKAISPCIDSGTAREAPLTDIEGNIRPKNAGYDMGAYEYQGAIANRIPIISITQPATDTVIFNQYTTFDFAGTAADPDGSIIGIESRLNGSSWQNVSGSANWTFSVSNLQEGDNLIEVRAKDNSNAYSTIASRTIRRNLIPSISVTNPASIQTMIPHAQTSYNIQGSASDSDGHIDEVYYSRNGGAWALASGASSWSFSVQNLVVGNNDFRICARDNTGDYSLIAERRLTRYPLKAEFSTSQTFGIAPLSIQFNNLSQGNLVRWEWDFDNDGIIDSLEQHPVHTFTSPGLYSIHLKVSDPQGSFDEILKETYLSIAPADAENLDSICACSTIPDEIDPSVPYDFTISFTNTGKEIWLAEGTVKLGAIGDCDPLCSYPRIMIDRNIRYGETYTFQLRMSQDAIGRYLTDWQMLKEGVAWFGETFRKQVKVGNFVPEIAISTPELDPVLPASQASVPFSGTASDQDGTILQVQYRQNNQEWRNATGNYQWFFTVRDLPIGNTLIHIRAQDDSEEYSNILTRNIERTTLLADFSYNPAEGTEPLSVQFTNQSQGSPTISLWDFNNDGITDSLEANPLQTYGSQGLFGVSLTVQKDGCIDKKTITSCISVAPENAENLSSQFINTTIPDVIRPSKDYSLIIRFKNTGKETWTPNGQIKLGAIGDSDPLIDALRVYAECNIRYGETCDFHVHLRSEQEGHFSTDWKMLKEGVAWFGEEFNKEVTVEQERTNIRKYNWSLFR